MGESSTGNLAPDSWFVRNDPRPGARLKLFCFPYAGGGAAIYREWASRLPSTVEVVPVELPGRGRRLKEPLFKRLPHLVDELTLAIHPLLTTPFAFFGHSMGAMIAFELARRLRSQYGREPEHLFVSGRPAPQLPITDRILYLLPEDQFIAELHKLNGTPSEILEHVELMEIILPVLRADFELVQTYEYTRGAPLSSPITAYGGTQDYEIKREDLLAWREQTNANFMLYMLPGDHFFLRSAQNALLQFLGIELHVIASALGGAA